MLVVELTVEAAQADTRDLHLEYVCAFASRPGISHTSVQVVDCILPAQCSSLCLSCEAKSGTGIGAGCGVAMATAAYTADQHIPNSLQHTRKLIWCQNTIACCSSLHTQMHGVLSSC